jgi:dGTPase
VEAISLCHDLGHSPFGHAGEEALNELMAEWGGFNHNRQSLRVVDRLERRYPEFDGLNLSWEIRESIAKHGDHPERALDSQFEPEWQPLLEAQLADIADSLAYSNHDIDDGLRAHFIQIEDLQELRLWQEAQRKVRDDYGSLDPKTLVARTISRLIDTQVSDLIEATFQRLEECGIDGPDRVRRHPSKLVGFSDEMTRLKKEADAFLASKLYRHYRVLKMAGKAKRFIAEIFGEYLRNPTQLPPNFQEMIPQEGKARVICDYIAGMTDRYCQDEYKRFFHPFERV